MKMLDRLYKILYLIFICGMMWIISIIICVVLKNQITTEQSNDKLLFQRMTTLIILQLENNKEHFEQNIKDYEKQYDIYCNLQNSFGEKIYESVVEFSTDPQYLLSWLDKHFKLTKAEYTANEQFITVQGGIFNIQGQNGDVYFGIPAKVVSKDNIIYNLTLFHKTRSLSDLLYEHFLMYILIWCVSLICVIMLSRLVLKQAFKPTEQVLKSQKDFITSASHELKSPLSVIFADVEKISKNDIASDELQKTITIIGSECMRMSKLINDMLTLASFDAKTWSLNKKKIDVDTLLISLYEAYEPICVKKKILLELNICDMHFPTLISDSERITQILGIFLDNAIHHSVGNSIIEIQTAVTPKAITFSVVDHGCGVSAQDKKNIFDRFYCADKSHTDKSHFGLGLSIADELTQMLGGKIGYKDTVGGGATFYITVPIK